MRRYEAERLVTGINRLASATEELVAAKRIEIARWELGGPVTPGVTARTALMRQIAADRQRLGLPV